MFPRDRAVLGAGVSGAMRDMVDLLIIPALSRPTMFIFRLGRVPCQILTGRRFVVFSRIRLIFRHLPWGLAHMFSIFAIIAPTFIVPRGGKRHINTPRASIDLSSEVERISRVNSELLAALFPDPNDWRRGNPLSAMPKDQSWLLLFPSDPKTENGGVTFESCTLVIPNTDTSLSEEERFRRGVVVETADRLEIRFKGQIDLQTLVVGFDPESLEGGRLYGKETIWSNMDPDTRADDFRLVTRNLSFNHEQITTDSEVLIHYGNWQAEGVGLRASLDLPFKKKDSTEAEVESPSPLSEEFAQGNLAHGFSVRDVSLDKLNRFEFEIDDYLPTLPGRIPGTVRRKPKPPRFRTNHKPSKLTSGAATKSILLLIFPPSHRNGARDLPERLRLPRSMRSVSRIPSDVISSISIWTTRF